ncbi:MAG: hypothetical protein C5S48_06160 [Candidatus Methanogaster sp.]|nr:MAG: hypothetical protein C5S48_06160 [ANME-2 cluster archaeon]
MIVSENFTFTHDVVNKDQIRKHGRAKSVAVLFDWTSEVQDKDIEVKFRIGGVRVRRLYDAG